MAEKAKRVQPVLPAMFSKPPLFTGQGHSTRFDPATDAELSTDTPATMPQGLRQTAQDGRIRPNRGIGRQGSR